MKIPKQIYFRLMLFNLVTSIAILAFVTSTFAQDRTWTNSSGGDFNDGGNWDTGVPSTSENAIFDLNASFSVDLNADTTIFSLQQHDGDISFSGGNTLTGNDLSDLNHGTMTISGAGTTISNLQSVGRDGGTGAVGNASLNILSGGSLTGIQTLLGAEVGTSGTATISGIDSTWTNSLDITVGRNGNGMLTVENGSVITSDTALIGSEASSDGTVTISGSGSQWHTTTTNGISRVGTSGTASLRIEDGGLFSGGNLLVGGSGDGTATVTGTDSQISTGLLTVNGLETSHLHVEAGGVVDNTSGVVSNIFGQSGTATVTGTGSQWNSSDALTIARAGTGILNVLNGGFVSAGGSNFSYIGRENGSDGTAVVSGTGSQLDLNALTIGQNGTASGQVRVEAGGNLTTESVIAGWTQDTTGSIVVNGAGSSWTNSGSSQIGLLGNGSLLIENGGMANLKFVTVRGDSNSNSSLRVTGNNSMLNSTAQIIVRSNGTGTLAIENGGSITSDDAFVLTDTSTASNIATVTGTGSQWNSGGVFVGGEGTAILNIQNGGQFNTTTATIGTVAGYSGTINVTGNDSVFSGTGAWLIGDEGVANLNISDSGRAATTGTATIATGSSVTIDSGEFSANVLINNGNVNVIGGDVTVAGQTNNTIDGRIETTNNATTIFSELVVSNGEVFTDNGSSVTFSERYTGSGSFTGTGDVMFESDVRLGNSPASVDFEGDVFLTAGSMAFIELAGINQGEFDQFDVAGDISLDGALSVSLINEFILNAGDEFLIGEVDGVAIGQFSGLGEGSLVGNFGGTDLFISYTLGNGNDVGLFTSAVPEPSSAFLVVLVFGGCLLRRRKNGYFMVDNRITRNP